MQIHADFVTKPRSHIRTPARRAPFAAVLAVLAAGLTACAAVAPNDAQEPVAPSPPASDMRIAPPANARGQSTPIPAPSRVRIDGVPKNKVGSYGPMRITGRLLLPDGSPASGSDVEISGIDPRDLSPDRCTYASPVGSTRAGDDGRFAFELASPRMVSLVLEARHAGHAPKKWSWSDVVAGTHMDMADGHFERACAITVRVLDASGSPSPVVFEVSSSSPNPDSGRSPGANHQTIVKASYDEKSRTYSLEGVPEGRCEIRGHMPIADEIEPLSATARPGEPLHLDLLYDGPDPAKRILVVCGSGGLSIPAAPERVRLRGPAGEIVAAEQTRMASALAFDDLAPGAYTIEVDDPRFERAVATGVEPGGSVALRMRGNSSLRVVLREGGRALDVAPDHMALCASASDLSSQGDGVNLLDSKRFSVVDGAITGVVAGDWELHVGVKGYPETRVAVRALQPGEQRTVVVDLGRARALRGVVLDGPGGSPSSGAVVLLTLGTRSGHGLGDSTSIGSLPAADHKLATGADGRFVFEDLQAGTYTLRVAWNDQFFADRTLEIGAEDPPALEIVAAESGGLDVELTLPAGATFEGVSLELGAIEPRRPTALVQAFGRGAVLVPGKVVALGPLAPGRYSASVAFEGKDGGAGGFGRREFDVVAGRRTKLSLDLRDSMPGSLRIRSKGGAAATPADFVYLVRIGGNKIGSGGARVDADGATFLAGASPGRVKLKFEGHAPTWTWTDPREFEIEPGRVLDVEVSIPVVVRTLVVRDAAGKSLAEQDVTVVAEGAATTEPVATHTDGLGLARIALLPGRFRIRAGRSESAPFDWSTTTAETLEVRVAPQ